jgi:glycosyltransferase involved in cell wall biosynthesis
MAPKSTSQGAGQDEAISGVTAWPLSQQAQRADVAPLVSVLCMTFNQGRYIRACLDSILSQILNFPAEIIVHDDASTDDTVPIVQGYVARYPELIRLIAQRENQHSRLRKIRPIMLERARGAFIANCDGDDVWLDPHKLAKQVDFLLFNPDYVLSFHDAVRLDADGRQRGTERVLRDTVRRDHSAADLRAMRWGWILMGTVVYRNVPLDFPPEYHLAPNGDNFMQVLLGGFGGAKFHADIGPLGYRQHAGSMWSSRSSAERLQMQLRTYLQIASYLLRVGEVEAATEIVQRQLAHQVRQLLGGERPPFVRQR